jgi:hypothetical protein
MIRQGDQAPKQLCRRCFCAWCCGYSLFARVKGSHGDASGPREEGAGVRGGERRACGDARATRLRVDGRAARVGRFRRCERWRRGCTRSTRWRIGQFAAVPFGVLNVALVVAWPRLRRRWRAAAALGLGLWWGVTVVPYHLVPLLEGSVTGENFSGLTRLIGGAGMVVLGFAMWRRGETGTPDLPPQ